MDAMRTCLIFCGVSAILTSCMNTPESTGGSRAAPRVQPKGADSVASIAHSFTSVQTNNDLPACQAANAQTTAYVKDAKSFYVCESNNWIAIDLKSASPEAPAPANEPTAMERWRAIWQKNVQKVGLIEAAYFLPNLPNCETMGRGTGFVVAKELVATNGHVIAPSYMVKAGSCPGLTADTSLPLASVKIWLPQTINGSVDTTSMSGLTVMQVDRSIAKSNDIALLNVPGLAVEPVTLSAKDEYKDAMQKEAVNVSDEVMLISYSKGFEFAQLTIGNINGFQPFNKFETRGNGKDTISLEQLVYIYDLVSTTGSSGGPLFDDKGEVIGVNFAESTIESLEYGFGIQVKHLRTLLTLPRQWTGLSPAK